MKFVKIVGTLGVFVGFCLYSRATFVPPGGSGLDPTQAPGPAPLQSIVPAYSTGNLSGTVTSWVTKDPANPLKGLSFYYQINNTGSDAVTGLTVSDFGIIPAATVDVRTIVAPYSTSLPGGVLPSTATRSPGLGSAVTFMFPGAGKIGAGAHSVILVVNTAYLKFQFSQGTVIGVNSPVNVAVLGPGPIGFGTGAPVPEPATFLAGSLLLIPLGASALRILRKRGRNPFFVEAERGLNHG